MKKIFSIFLIAFAALTGNVFSAEAQSYDMTKTPGEVKFKMNIKDISTGAPVSGAYIQVYIKTLETAASPDVRKPMVLVGPSGNDGVAYGIAYFSNNAGQSGVFGNGVGHIWSPTASGFGAVWMNQRIDFDPNPSDQYAYVVNSSTRGRVRNWVSGNNATKYDRNDFGGHDCYLSGNWVTEGAVIEFDQYVEQKGTTRTVSFDTSDISNASQFTAITVNKGDIISAGSIPAPVCTNSNNQFQYWSIDKQTPFDFTQPINANITLKAVWRNPNAQGVIRFKVFMWDHDKYNLRARPAKSADYKYELTGVNGGKAMSNYEPQYYINNEGYGWTEIPVSGLRFKLRTYIDEAGLPKHPVPVGLPETEGWQDDSSISTIVTDSNGEATYTITSDNMRYLTPGFVIDSDPDPNCLASIVRKYEYGREFCVFNWDWMTISDLQGAGLMGVRYVLEGPRHLDTGIKIGNHNDNDAILLTDANIKEGFEATFYCYVLPAPCAQFDVNGGTMPSGYDETRYPIQKFTPLNSAGVEIDPWIVKNPGNPAAPAADMVFAGWFEVRTDLGGVEYESPTPFDFTKTIDRSVVLRAKYVYPAQLYTVRWAPDGWTGASNSDLYEIGTTYESGDMPTFNQELPSASGMTVSAWDLFEKDESGAEDFGTLGKYKYVKTIIQPASVEGVTTDSMSYIEASGTSFWQSPYAINDADQIYRAKFRTALTVTKSGLKAGDSAVFTISNGTETRKIVLTGNTAGTAVSKTLYLDAGTWTVTEEMGWSWAYENSTSSKNVTIADGAHETVTFTNSPKSTTPQHGESSVNNTFSESSSDGGILTGGLGPYYGREL